MECKICKHEMNELNNFFTCECCGFAKKHHIPSETEEKDRYLLHQYDENYFFYMKSIYDKFITPNVDNILDFGCGRIPVLSQVFCKNKFVNYDYYFHRTNYKENLYDLIILNEVIEHLEEPLDTIVELSNLLKENGKIIIHTVLFNSFNELSNWWYTRDITHISFFQYKTFEYVAKELELNISLNNKLIILAK